AVLWSLLLAACTRQPPTQPAGTLPPSAPAASQVAAAQTTPGSQSAAPPPVVQAAHEKRDLVVATSADVSAFDPHMSNAVNDITQKPDPLLPARFASYGGQIMPQKYFTAVGPDVFNRKPVGSGVVKLKEWVKDDHLTLEANPEYWGGAPDFDTVTFKPIPEPG